jgi:uncharacterized protein (TIGR00730 family)
MIDSVCLFCGAAKGSDPRLAQAVRDFVLELAARDITLVTGGGSTGLMGVAADAMLEAGGRVIGIIPEKLLQREVAHKGLTEMHVVETMHDRKAMMWRLSDAFVTGPGGIGTMEELFEIFTWRQLGYHDKPVTMLNVAGFYDPLLKFLDEAVAMGLLQPGVRKLLCVETDPKRLAKVLDGLSPVAPGVELDAAAS